MAHEPPHVPAHVPPQLRAALGRPDFHATTANALDGYDVVETYGVVRGITVRSRSVFGTLGAVFQQLRGGEVTLLTELCEQTRRLAFELTVEHAQLLGANALLALRYDATEIMTGVSEVLCYGTAVRVVPREGARATTEAVPAARS
jgi:uncharacterized protein YbjQ (UPF0145 family)